jgi:hypothetical protein
VFNTCLARPGYTPDAAAPELGKQVFTNMFTRHEISTAAAELPLEPVADDSVPTAWPLVSGLAVFDVEREDCPIEVRRLGYQKTS